MENPNECIDTPRIEDHTIVPETNDAQSKRECVSSVNSCCCLVDQTQTITAPSHVLNEKRTSNEHDDDQDSEIRIENKSSSSNHYAGKTKVFDSKGPHIGIMIAIGINVLGTSLGALLNSVDNESVFIRGTTLAALAVMPTLCSFAKETLWTRKITIGIMVLFYFMAGYTAAVAGRGFLAFFFWNTSFSFLLYFGLITLKDSRDITEK